MLRQRLVAALAALAAAFLLVYGATARTHRVVLPSSGQGSSVIEVDDPLVIQATCTGEVTMGTDGRLQGDPSTWGDTAGKACPT